MRMIFVALLAPLALGGCASVWGPHSGHHGQRPAADADAMASCPMMGDQHDHKMMMRRQKADRMQHRSGGAMPMSDCPMAQQQTPPPQAAQPAQPAQPAPPAQPTPPPAAPPQ